MVFSLVSRSISCETQRINERRESSSSFAVLTASLLLLLHYTGFLYQEKWRFVASYLHERGRP